MTSKSGMDHSIIVMLVSVKRTSIVRSLAIYVYNTSPRITPSDVCTHIFGVICPGMDVNSVHGSFCDVISDIDMLMSIAQNGFFASFFFPHHELF